jgi:hypothetical protein
MTLMIEKKIYFEHDGFVISECTYEDRIILGNFIDNNLKNGLIRYNNGIIIFGTFNNNGLNNGIIYYPGNNEDYDAFSFQSANNQLLQKFKLLKKPVLKFTHRIINGYFESDKTLCHGYIEAYYDNGSKTKKNENNPIHSKYSINIIDNNIVTSCLNYNMESCIIGNLNNEKEFEKKLISFMLKEYYLQSNKNRELSCNILNIDPLAIEYIENKDHELVLRSVMQDWLSLKFIIEEKYLNDQQIVLESIKQNYQAIQYVPDNIERYYEFAYEAVKINSLAIQHISKINIEKYFELAKEAVLIDGMVLQFINNVENNVKPNNLKNYEVCFAAVKSNGLAVQFIFDDDIDNFSIKHNLINDNNNYDTIAKTAFEQNNLAFEYIKKERISKNLLSKLNKIINKQTKRKRNSEKLTRVSIKKNKKVNNLENKILDNEINENLDNEINNLFNNLKKLIDDLDQQLDNNSIDEIINNLNKQDEIINEINYLLMNYY